jgi:hypothetical protein
LRDMGVRADPRRHARLRRDPLLRR